MTKERLEEVLNNLIAWAVDHDEEFLDCFIYAAGFTDEEKKELELCEETDEDDCELGAENCPYCGSSDIDVVDTQNDSNKYICRSCGEDFLVWGDGTITDRHNREIRKEN